MKSFLRSALFVIGSLLITNYVEAQVNVTVHAEWQAPAPQTGVPVPTSYNVQFDSSPIQSVGTTLDTACNCLRSPIGGYNVVDAAVHTVKVWSVTTAGNLGPQQSAPLVLTFAVLVPGIPTNLSIKVGP